MLNYCLLGLKLAKYSPAPLRPLQAPDCNPKDQSVTVSFLWSTHGMSPRVPSVQQPLKSTWFFGGIPNRGQDKSLEGRPAFCSDITARGGDWDIGKIVTFHLFQYWVDQRSVTLNSPLKQVATVSEGFRGSGVAMCDKSTMVHFQNPNSGAVLWSTPCRFVFQIRAATRT